MIILLILLMKIEEKQIQELHLRTLKKKLFINYILIIMLFVLNI